MNNSNDLSGLHEQSMALDKTKWLFIGRSERDGYLGFRAIAGVGSILDDHWVGDLYIEPEAFYSGSWSSS